MEILDKSSPRSLAGDLILPVVLMATFGTFYWAIRGTGGFGGSTGGLYAGIGWASCWWFLANKRDNARGRYSSRWVLPCLAVGIAAGGLHGYGQFVSWIRGVFYLEVWVVSEAIDPAWGFMAMLQSGLSWGLTAGVVLSWARSERRPTIMTWLVRAGTWVGGGLVGYVFFLAFPGLLMPLYSTGIYENLASCSQCVRTIETAASSAILFGMSCGQVVGEVLLREKRAVLLAAILGTGFGAGFVFGTGWFFTDVPSAWKCWEMSIGAIGGASIGVAYWACNRDEAGDSQRSRGASWSKGHGSINLVVTLSMMVVVVNGLKDKGFAGNFFNDDPVTTGVVLWVAIVLAVLLGVAFLTAWVRQSKGLQPTPLFKTPAREFTLVQVVLVAIGFAVSLHPVMNSTNWFLVSTYIAVLALGTVAVIVDELASRVHR